MFAVQFQNDQVKTYIAKDVFGLYRTLLKEKAVRYHNEEDANNDAALLNHKVNYWRPEKLDYLKNVSIVKI